MNCLRLSFYTSVSPADSEKFTQDGHLNDPPNFLSAESFDDHVSALKPILEMVVLELVTSWLVSSVDGDTHYTAADDGALVGVD